jgi:hypothetical protein
LAASGLVAALSRLTGQQAAKAKKAKGPCGKCGTFCEPRTAAVFCNSANEDCTCFRSTSGKVHCADSTLAECPPSSSPDQCRQDADCGPDAICVKTAAGLCCSEPDKAQVNICIPLCTAAPAAVKSGKSNGSMLGVRDRLSGH